MSDQESLRAQDLQEEPLQEAGETTGNPSQQETQPSSGDASSAERPVGEDLHSADGKGDAPQEAAQEADPKADQNAKETAELKKQLEELQKENSELKNQYLRKQADTENYRKRMIRDKEDAVSFANQQLLLDLTAVIDDFERAIASAEESRDYDAFHDGVVLIEKQLVNMLERKWGLKRLDSEGQEFDPQKHEAVTAEPRDEDETSMVLEEYQKGYMLHDRVLRAARVKVSTPGKG
ncbi:molecular chaperone GrpE [Alkalispirochaeta americana]|uniref:Protein GrpE n=1 Tax=Alkalispirochaeta americana TaxID=159291 RepID=A0A1N6W1Z3_9SPIO|nr:nucleotide exchange factor GrpE [Alkalispirochaeta americana]SIQ84012.1 molecular chaperone GrpE [Alkalispirochaeta americana]